jgi:cytochrome o ubiquinol oxidase subunit 2
MRFRFAGLSNDDFERWVARNRSAGQSLDRAGYLKLDQPSVKEAVRRYARVDADLYGAIVERCVEEGKMCQRQMMAIDEAGGLGKAGLSGVSRTNWRGTERSVVAALCTPVDPEGRLSLAGAATAATTSTVR